MRAYTQQCMFVIILLAKSVAAADGRKTLHENHVRIASAAFRAYCPQALPLVK